MSVIAQAIMLAFSGGGVAPPGEVVFNAAGTISWTVPAGVFEVSVVTVGGGNGHAANDTLTGTGTSYFKDAATCVGYGSKGRFGGSFVGDGGGVGGSGGLGYVWTVAGYADDYIGGGGGGAGGYAGTGGNGQGAGPSQTSNGYGGGGVGIFGQGASGGAASGQSGTVGTGGAAGGGAAGMGANAIGSYGKAGSNGTNGGYGVPGVYGGGMVGMGDAAGGGGLGWRNKIAVTPGQVITIKVGIGGAVRVMWGGNRSFPLNAAAI